MTTTTTAATTATATTAANVGGLNVSRGRIVAHQKGGFTQKKLLRCHRW